MAKKWSSDRIVSFSAILISLITLVVFIYQTRLMAEQQRLSVLPYLSYGFRNSGSADFTVYISNDGIGPAFVESIKITYQDSVYEADLPTFLYQNIPAMDSMYNIRHSNIIPGHLIPAGRRIPILEGSGTEEDANRLYQLLVTLDFEAELIYKSAYNERWRLSTDGYVPEKID